MDSGHSHAYPASMPPAASAGTAAYPAALSQNTTSLPRLSAVWWGIGARLLLAVALTVLLWLVIRWALQ